MDIDAWLDQFDGKNISTLSEARMACRDRPDYLDVLIALCRDTRGCFADGASWMLKAELEDGTALAADQIENLSQALKAVPTWQAWLHICQMIDHLSLTAPQAQRFVDWGQGLRDHKRPFLRAWSLHLLVFIAKEFPTYADAAEQALILAEQDTAASVRARARQLRKS